MFKKILLSSLLATSFVTSVAVAGVAPYIGAGIGITTNTSNSKGSITVINQPFQIINGDLGSYRGVPFNVFAGYGGTINENMYLAGEVTGTIGNATISNNGVLKTSYGYGASVLPGIMLSDHTLAFGRVGVVGTRFSNLEKTRAGAQVGVGMQTTVTQNVDLRGEYDFTAYKSVNKFKFTESGTPRTDAFNVGLVYKFE